MTALQQTTATRGLALVRWARRCLSSRAAWRKAVGREALGILAGYSQEEVSRGVHREHLDEDLEAMARAPFADPGPGRGLEQLVALAGAFGYVVLLDGREDPPAVAVLVYPDHSDAACRYAGDLAGARRWLEEAARDDRPRDPQPPGSGARRCAMTAPAHAADFPLFAEELRAAGVRPMDDAELHQAAVAILANVFVTAEGEHVARGFDPARFAPARLLLNLFGGKP